MQQIADKTILQMQQANESLDKLPSEFVLTYDPHQYVMHPYSVNSRRSTGMHVEQEYRGEVISFPLPLRKTSVWTRRHTVTPPAPRKHAGH